GAEAGDVGAVRPEALEERALEARREGEALRVVGGEEAAERDAADGRRRVRRRDVERRDLLPGLAHVIPDALELHVAGRGDRERVALAAVAEAVEPELARIAARGHRGPRRHRDRRLGRSETAEGALASEPREAGHHAGEAIEDERG